MSSASIVFHHGLRSTRIRQAYISVSVPPEISPLIPSISNTPASSVSSSAPASSQTSSTSLWAYSTSASTPFVAHSSLFDPAPSDKIHPTIPLLTTDDQSTPLPNASLIPPASVTSGLSFSDTNTEPNTPTSTIQSTPSGPSNSTSSLAGLSASTTRTDETRPSSTNPPTATEAGITGASPSPDVTKNTRARVVAGSILGVLAFIVVISLICFLLLRRRRRIYGNSQRTSSNGKLSRMNRYSTATLTSLEPRYLSGFPSHSSDPSLSQPNQVHHSHGPLDSPKPVLIHNPLSKSTGLPSGLQPDNRGPIPENPFADPDPVSAHSAFRQPRSSKPSLTGLQTIPQGKTDELFIQQSIYGSDNSLGSTITLPGRNSVGSLQVISYRISNPSSASPRLVDAIVRRLSTRSDPFDLEIPANAVHSRV